MGGAAISTNRTAPSLRTLRVSNTMACSFLMRAAGRRRWRRSAPVTEQGCAALEDSNRWSSLERIALDTPCGRPQYGRYGRCATFVREPLRGTIEKGLHVEERGPPLVTCDRQVTALLVIDPYSDFISEGGKLW